MKIYMWVICGIGLPANILIIATISTFRSRGPAPFLLCLLAVIDNAVLVAKLIESNISAYQVELGRYGCKMVEVPFRTLAAIRNWTVAVMCAKRYLAVCKPFKRNVWISNRRCRLIVSLISTILTMCVL
ncbi:unnamed protein product, partial [Lymnaea stagnalis]